MTALFHLTQGHLVLNRAYELQIPTTATQSENSLPTCGVLWDVVSVMFHENMKKSYFIYMQ